MKKMYVACFALALTAGCKKDSITDILYFKRITECFKH